MGDFPRGAERAACRGSAPGGARPGWHRGGDPGGTGGKKQGGLEVWGAARPEHTAF